MQTTVTLQGSGFDVGRIRQLTDTPSTDYAGAGRHIPPTGGGDDPPRHRPGGGRGDDGRPSRLEYLLAAIAAEFILAGISLLLLALIAGARRR